MPQKDVEYLKMFFDERIKNLEKDIQKNFEILIEKHDNSAERITKIEVETEFFRLCHRYPKTAILIVAGLYALAISDIRNPIFTFLKTLLG